MAYKHSWAAASRPMPPASAFRHHASQSGNSIPIPDCSLHWHLYSLRHRIDRMPYRPAFWHLKELYEGEEGYTQHLCTAGGRERYTLHVQTSDSKDGYTLHVHTDDGIDGYTPCTCIQLVGERDTPCMSTLLALDRDTPCTSHCRCC